MQGADKGSSGELDGAGLRIGLVRARFNEAVTDAIATACLSELERLEVEAGAKPADGVVQISIQP